MALNVTNLRCHWSDCRGKKANSRLKEEDKHERCPVRGARYMLFLDWWVKIVHWYHGCDLIRTLLAGVVVVQCSVDLLFCQLLALRMKIYKSHTHETAFLELYFGGVFEIPTWTYLFTLFHFIFVCFIIYSSLFGIAFPRGVYSANVNYGEVTRRAPTLTLLCTIFERKGIPFVYVLLTKGTPFTYQSYPALHRF